MANKPRDFSRRVYAIPFGRYEAQGASEPPANEVLIGREGQRAYLIDLLLRLGRRGAFLVTGRRGVGKTSFVGHCLAEYRDEVFERFLRSSVGRATFWDRVGVVVFAVVGLVLALMASELMEVLILAAQGGTGGTRDVLVWIVILPLILICLHPILFARELLRQVLEVWKRSGKLVVWRFPTLFVVVAGGVFWRFGHFGAPALSLSELFLAASLVYFGSETIAHSSWHSGSPAGRFALVTWWALWLAFLSSILLGPCQFPEFLGRWAAPLEAACKLGLPWLDPALDALKRYQMNFALGVGVLGSGLAIRGVGHWLESGGGGENVERKALSLWFSYFGPGLLMILGAIAFLLVFLHFSALVPLGVLVVIGALRSGVQYRKYRKVPPTPRPTKAETHPLLVLVLKALLAIVVGLQLLHPLLANWNWPKDLAQFPNLVVAAKSSAPIARNQLRPPQALYVVSGLDAAPRATETEGEADFKSRDLFHGVKEEIHWVFALFLSLLLIYFLEYEWIVRPFVREREDRAIDPTPAGTTGDAQGKKEHRPHLKRQDYHDLAALTLPWILYRAWLPLLVVSVNLGFERLDHRRVVHAMLAGLRTQYQRTFLGWNSVIANLGRLAGLIIFVILMTLVGERWFAMPKAEELPEREELTRAIGPDYSQVCNLFEGRQRGAGAVNLICQMKWGERIFHSLYYNLMPPETSSLYRSRNDHVLFHFLPYRSTPWPPAGAMEEDVEPLLAPGLHFRVYHLLLFLTIFLVGRWALVRVPVFPYSQVVQRIDQVMDNLSSKTRVTSRHGRWRPAEWIQSFFMDERVRQTEQDPVDPRTVEFLFLQILQDIESSPVNLPGGASQRVSFPVPEILFVFDELDKLGTRVNPQEGPSGGGPQQAEILNAERRRSMELHRLLADMKNLLSSAPARFIFVGGRNLHDEWQADQTARQPLLTNIFNAEIYLPSLLTDRPARPQGAAEEEASRLWRLDIQVRRYLQRHYDRACELFERYQRKRAWPSFALPLEKTRPETFVQEDRDSELALRVYDTEPPARREEETPQGEVSDPGNGTVASEVPGADEVVRDFVQFLTYRSMGNPKKLKELLASFLRPVGQLVEDSGLRNGPFRCQHVLTLPDVERLRIQLLADVYRHLTLTLEKRLVERDDKLAISVFYLADFLFKFHRRAFSWTNLERVDELVHIHRAPDLRDVLETIVVQWSERFLHPIRNGMYDFRFRSDLAHEVEYISRQSHDEMAAFNFTLDESLTLKSLYQSQLQPYDAEANEEVKDLLAGLGELYEFDQEYETARFHYRRAVALIDEELQNIIGAGNVLHQSSAAIDIIGGGEKGQESARRYITWGVARLRLMLQIGMTFELSRNLERAQVEYRDARTLAQSLVLAMLDDEGRRVAALLEESSAPVESKSHRLEVLKHLNILFQPAFAEAWSTEKLTGGVDTSLTLVEKTLWSLRCTLPFLRDPGLGDANPIRVANSNFALISAELHNKAGDLCFLKGRQQVDGGTIEEWATAVDQGCPRVGLEGFLLRAHYHYAVGLHDLRRFVSYRRTTSKEKLNIWSKEAFAKLPRKCGDSIRETIEPGSWPDFVYRSVGGGINDVAEAMLGRVSLFALLTELGSLKLQGSFSEGDGDKSTAPRRIRGELVESFTKWMEEAAELTTGRQLRFDSSETAEREIRVPIGGMALECGKLRDWLGRWRYSRKRSDLDDWRLIEFTEAKNHDDARRLVVALNFTLAGAKYLEKGGYIEDAARELLGVAETVTHYIWWLTASRFVVANHPSMVTIPAPVNKVMAKDEIFRHPYWCYLIEVAVYALEKADRLFRRSRRAEEAEVFPRASDDGSGTGRNGGGTAEGMPLYLVGYKIPPAAHTLACSLGLAMQRLQDLNTDASEATKAGSAAAVQRDSFERLCGRLRSLLAGWLRGGVQSAESGAAEQRASIEDLLRAYRAWGGSEATPSGPTGVKEAGAPGLETILQGILRESLVRHSYPMINRLHTLKVLIDDAVLSRSQGRDTPGAPSSAEICSWAEELLRLKSMLNAPMHFTPMHSGVTAALVYLGCRSNGAGGEGVSPERLARMRRTAERELESSEEMYTMRRAYYEAISDLYYLYDDFNDRQIHFNFAIQMAGTELVSLLRLCVHEHSSAKEREGVGRDDAGEESRE